MVWKNVKNRYERDGRMNPLLLLSQESMTIIAEEQPVKQFAKLILLCILWCGFCFSSMRNAMYFKLSHLIAQTVTLDLVF